MGLGQIRAQPCGEIGFSVWSVCEGVLAVKRRKVMCRDIGVQRQSFACDKTASVGVVK